MTAISFRFGEYRRTFAALTALSVCLMVGAAGAAHAATTDAAPTVVVAYGDLNLGTDQGANTLYARIVSAARQVCFVDEADGRDLQRFMQAKACETHAIARAVSEVHSPRLAALYGARLRHG